MGRLGDAGDGRRVVGAGSIAAVALALVPAETDVEGGRREVFLCPIAAGGASSPPVSTRHKVDSRVERLMCSAGR